MGNNVPSRGNIKYKRPEREMCLVSSRTGKSSATGTQSHTVGSTILQAQCSSQVKASMPDLVRVCKGRWVEAKKCGLTQ